MELFTTQLNMLRRIERLPTLNVLCFDEYSRLTDRGERSFKL